MSMAIALLSTKKQAYVLQEIEQLELSAPANWKRANLLLKSYMEKEKETVAFEEASETLRRKGLEFLADKRPEILWAYFYKIPDESINKSQLVREIAAKRSALFELVNVLKNEHDFGIIEVHVLEQIDKVNSFVNDLRNVLLNSDASEQDAFLDSLVPLRNLKKIETYAGRRAQSLLICSKDIVTGW